MTPDAAQIFALKALGWLAGEDELSGAFLGASGLAPEDLPARADDPEFLGFVLDFLLGDEDALLACMAALGAPPETAMQARAALPGGDAPFWT